MISCFRYSAQCYFLPETDPSFKYNSEHCHMLQKMQAVQAVQGFIVYIHWLDIAGA